MRDASEARVQARLEAFDGWHTTIRKTCEKITLPGLATVVEHLMLRLRNRIASGERSIGILADAWCVRGLMFRIVDGWYSSGVVRDDGSYVLVSSINGIQETHS